MAATLQTVAEDRDLERLLAIRNAIESRPLTAETYRAERTATVGNLGLVAVADGNDVGAGEVIWDRASAEAGVAFVKVWVLPAARRRGVGRLLLDNLIAFARNAGMTSLRAVVGDGDDDSLAFAARRGFEVAGRGQDGALDLAAIDPPQPSGMPGIEITTLAERPELDRAIYDLMMRVRPDVPVLADEPVPTFEAWSADTIEDPGFMPELTVIAIGGGRVVGAVELFDNTGGAIYIGMTAVDPDFRRRGLARLLKVELSRRAKAAGVVRIETYNDGANTGIRTLNESLGYVYLPWRLMLRGPVPVQALEQADSRAG